MVSAKLLERIRAAWNCRGWSGWTSARRRGTGSPSICFAARAGTVRSGADSAAASGGAEKTIACVEFAGGLRDGGAFCATGRMGFVRNLAAWEMVDQVVRIAQDAEHPVRGVVFMAWASRC
jgi:hypothetical protein